MATAAKRRTAHTLEGTTTPMTPLVGESPYRQAQIDYPDPDDFYEYLRRHRLDHSSLCLGYYLERAQREENLTQQEIADRTRTDNEAPVTRSLLSSILSGRTGVRADTWRRIADAVGANPLEFFISEGWIDPSWIAAYQVPQSSLLLPIARKLEEVPEEQRLAVVSMITAVIDTMMAHNPRPAKSA